MLDTQENTTNPAQDDETSLHWHNSGLVQSSAIWEQTSQDDVLIWNKKEKKIFDFPKWLFTYRLCIGIVNHGFITMYRKIYSISTALYGVYEL